MKIGRIDYIEIIFNLLDASGVTSLFEQAYGIEEAIEGYLYVLTVRDEILGKIKITDGNVIFEKINPVSAS